MPHYATPIAYSRHKLNVPDITKQVQVMSPSFTTVTLRDHYVTFWQWIHALAAFFFRCTGFWVWDGEATLSLASIAVDNVLCMPDEETAVAMQKVKRRSVVMTLRKKKPQGGAPFRFENNTHPMKSGEVSWAFPCSAQLFARSHLPEPSFCHDKCVYTGFFHPIYVV